MVSDGSRIRQEPALLRRVSLDPSQDLDPKVRHAGIGNNRISQVASKDPRCKEDLLQHGRFDHALVFAGRITRRQRALSSALHPGRLHSATFPCCGDATGGGVKLLAVAAADAPKPLRRFLSGWPQSVGCLHLGPWATRVKDLESMGPALTLTTLPACDPYEREIQKTEIAEADWSTTKGLRTCVAAAANSGTGS